ncbi:DUF871 domain-containing protein [Dellaglioa algida]|uniref:DUF871 domain-containing protein n=1 Tax=Dellaglioa algida TaxID=105612 RepID=UPI0024C4E2BC|nr:MupG family TIM beta-alpha barrel fold protein [Dellaglioa algida]MDK1728562.1 MupG family TIM beta-alpha barrel fold protein [Dellaglioa algida]MDK1736194.1 MupG family TIM beta-alpha barrel fold protein [Dellaglioa algida]MDK1737959.1 MupG family TIM beta-alpha barrel fold protein [Dellaglioa algida]
MSGFSIFMNSPLTKEIKKYIQIMAEAGFTGIFTSMHVPEDNVSAYKQRLVDLGACARKNNLKLMVDISGEALKKAGFSFDRLDLLKKIGVTGLRMDYNIPFELMAKVSQEITISINASTLVQDEVDILRMNGANFDNFEAWHNYYPRPETGLSKKSFLIKNQFLIKNGFKPVAFVPGNKNLRGPLFEGLPTLEDHRRLHPLACSLDLFEMGITEIYIGDGGLEVTTIEQYRIYFKSNRILLHADDVGSEYFEYVLQNHINRVDDARDVIRSADARFWHIPEVRPEMPRFRTVGSITVDNQLYGRYMGEIQVVKRDLVIDERVNVVGEIVKDERCLLDFIKPGQKFTIKKYKRLGEN